MAEAGLKILHAGPHVTLQDGGRPGFMRFGVAASGPMDRKALIIANHALGNPPGMTGIEVSLGGLVLECMGRDLTMAVAGGGFIREVDGQRGGSWAVFTLRKGQRLVLRRGPWGAWACLALAGQVQAAPWLGSRATHGPSGLGGRVLRAGDVLSVAEARVLPGAVRAIPCPVWARPRPVLHAVPGPQDRFFSPAALADLGSAPFRLTSAYDRMGVRLQGPPLIPEGALSIPSEAVLRGSVQVSGEGTATILMADHQTTGGYPKIATVIADDLDGFAQCRPGDALRFRLITPEAAVALARLRAGMLAQWLAAQGQTGL